jgi:hypothetical protein
MNTSKLTFLYFVEVGVVVNVISHIKIRHCSMFENVSTSTDIPSRDIPVKLGMTEHGIHVSNTTDIHRNIIKLLIIIY